jgi:cell fate regulator YaaT (PSP1 superfamily)
MFIKNGDLQPISIIEPSDIDEKNAKQQLKKVLSEAEKEEPEVLKNNSKESKK